MDAIDREILEILQSEARITMKEIGQRIGLTSPSIIERVKKLEDNGIINGYKAIIDFAKAGLSLKAIITVTVDGQAGPRFEEFTRQRNHILECHRVTGPFQYVLLAAVPGLKELETLTNRIAEFGPTSSYLILSSPVQDKQVSFSEYPA